MTAPDHDHSARHRADEPPLLPFSRRVVRPLVAVTSVLVVVLLLLVVNGRGTPGDGPGPGAVAQLPSTGTRTPASVVTSLPSAAATTAAASPTASALPASEPPATQPPARAVVTKIPVTVLNNSRHTGLAHAIADRLRHDGWPIRQTGNFTGRIRTTTVYYAPGEQRSAYALARDYPSIHRVLPRFAGLPGHGLTLVITRDWSG